jgi:PQQ system protein
MITNSHQKSGAAIAPDIFRAPSTARGIERPERHATIDVGILNEEVEPMTMAQERADLLSKLGLDVQNRAALGRVLGTGNIGQATEKADGRMAATIRIRPDELSWDPSILVLPHGGDVDLELINDDLNTHCALLPSNGDRKFIWLVNHSRGRATLNLDGPGYYWFSSPTGNDEGRGLTGAIVVLGDVPPEARLDRPDQPRP